MGCRLRKLLKKEASLGRASIQVTRLLFASAEVSYMLATLTCFQSVTGGHADVHSLHKVSSAASELFLRQCLFD